jgi:hypothetical protein
MSFDTKKGNEHLQDSTTFFGPTIALHDNQHAVTSSASSAAHSTLSFLLLLFKARKQPWKTALGEQQQTRGCM